MIVVYVLKNTERLERIRDRRIERFRKVFGIILLAIAVKLFSPISFLCYKRFKTSI